MDLGEAVVRASREEVGNDLEEVRQGLRSDRSYGVVVRQGLRRFGRVASTRPEAMIVRRDALVAKGMSPSFLMGIMGHSRCDDSRCAGELPGLICDKALEVHLRKGARQRGGGQRHWGS